MKKLNLLLGVLLGVILFTSCNSDDENLPEPSFFTYNGKEYETPSLYRADHYIQEGDNYAYSFLASNVGFAVYPTISYGDDNNCGFEDGLTHFIRFKVVSSTRVLTEGIYHLKSSNSTEAHIENVELAIDIVTKKGCISSSDSIGDITGGNIIVEKQEESKTLIYTFYIANLGTITGRLKMDF